MLYAAGGFEPYSSTSTTHVLERKYVGDIKTSSDVVTSLKSHVLDMEKWNRVVKVFKVYFMKKPYLNTQGISQTV